MFAAVEEIGNPVDAGESGLPLNPARDPVRDIDSPAFLAVLRGNSPAAERAFRHLDCRLRARLRRFLGRWFRESGTVDEILQEIFLAVHEGLPTFPGGCGLTTWVYSLAYEMAKHRLSDEYSACPASEDFPARVAEVAAADPMPDEAVHRSLLVGLVRSAADTLPAHYREVWLLCDVEERSGEEAAEVLGITAALARVRLHRARGLIADRLRKERPGLFRKIRPAGPSRHYPGRRQPAGRNAGTARGG